MKTTAHVFSLVKPRCYKEFLGLSYQNKLRLSHMTLDGTWNSLECVGMAHGMCWNGLEFVGMCWNVLEWPLESSGMNLESVGMEFHLDSIGIWRNGRFHPFQQYFSLICLHLWLVIYILGWSFTFIAGHLHSWPVIYIHGQSFALIGGRFHGILWLAVGTMLCCRGWCCFMVIVVVDGRKEECHTL